MLDGEPLLELAASLELLRSDIIDPLSGEDMRGAFLCFVDLPFRPPTCLRRAFLSTLPEMTFF